MAYSSHLVEAARCLHGLAVLKHGAEPPLRPTLIEAHAVEAVAERYGVPLAALRREFGARFRHKGFYAEAFKVGQRVSTSLGLGTVAGFGRGRVPDQTDSGDDVVVTLDDPKAWSLGAAPCMNRWAVSGDLSFNQFGRHA